MSKARRRAVHRGRSLWRRLGRWQLPVAASLLLLLALLIVSPWGCTPRHYDSGVPLSGRLIRVRLIPQPVDSVVLTASQSPLFFTATESAPRQLNLPRNTGVVLKLAPDGWRMGSTKLGAGELTLRPTAVGSVSVNDRPYRGQYRFVPVGPDRFDVVNDVDLDDYLCGVLSRELLSGWDRETYRAQAIVARTYAMYEKYAQREPRHWDVYADTRSQVYGGIADETAKSRDAVDTTIGIVVANGQRGEERIFKAYFSACCGGVTQSVADAFGEPEIEPLSAQSVGPLCSASPKFNWPRPIVISKEELTRRFQTWGATRGRPIKDMAPLSSIQIESARLGRPVRFSVVDIRGNRYPLLSEELRWAVNTNGSEGSILFSSYVETIINDSDAIRFLGGHGHGHGVGMCQWCAEARAKAGMRHEDIVLAAYPGAKLLRAY